eukprot:SAG11_NODE_15875_length_563_cov_6.491379_1_plen_50_part_10
MPEGLSKMEQVKWKREQKMKAAAGGNVVAPAGAEAPPAGAPPAGAPPAGA